MAEQECLAVGGGPRKTIQAGPTMCAPSIGLLRDSITVRRQFPSLTERDSFYNWRRCVRSCTSVATGGENSGDVFIVRRHGRSLGCQSSWFGMGVEKMCNFDDR